MSNNSELNPAEMFAKAVQMQKEGRLPEAKELGERLVAAYPRHADGLHFLGLIRAQLGHLGEAVELLQRSIEVSPTSAAVWGHLGKMYLDLKKFDEAVATFKRAIAIQPDLPHFHIGLGDALTETGDNAAAEASYRRALILNPALATPHNRVGAALRPFGLYISHRPDSDVRFSMHPELSELYPKWIADNLVNNSGDIPRLYAWILNIKQVMADKVPGHFAEIGVYRGNSAAVLAHYARCFGRTVYLFDTFEGFDPRDLIGIDANPGRDIFQHTSLQLVRSLVGEDAVVYVKGHFPGSIPPQLANKTFSVVNIDCDLYEPTKASLEYFYPRLSPGGILLLHDYSSGYFIGAKRAIDEFVATVPENLVLLPDKSGTAIIRKNRK